MIEYFKKKYIDSEYFTNYNIEKYTKRNLQAIKIKLDKNYKYLLENPITKIERINVDSNLLVSSNKYFHKSITDDINSKTKYNVNIKYLTPNGIDIDYNFFILSTNPKKDDVILKYASLMTVWLMTVKDYELDNCVKNLKVSLYLTNKKKELPIVKNHILGGKEVNTAFTYRCKHDDSSITLYREEDLMKVFIHETFHTFNLDFVNPAKENIQEHYSINSDVNLYESYCETWARIINALFYSFIFEKKHNVKYDLVLPSILSIETLYSLNQIIKIINYMGITIEEMIRNDKKVSINFKEESNVFSYYFITSILMLNLENFMIFCDDNKNILSFNSNNLQNYIDLIKNIKISMINGKYNNIIKLVKNNKRTTSTKMAIFDVIEIF